MTQIESRSKVQPSKGSGQPKRNGSSNPSSKNSVPPTIAPPPPKNQSPIKWLLRGVILTSLVAASTTLGLAAALLIPLPTGLAFHNNKQERSLDDLWQTGLQYQIARPVNILVMGIDRVPGAAQNSKSIFDGRSDTMLLVRLDPQDDSVKLLSIPRDTQVDIPGIGVVKINDANVEGGPKLAATTVSNTLNGVQIDRYVRVSTEAFRELVDLLGGVEVYVPKPMSYTDQTQKLKINLSPGLQTLNGDQAEQFARFRHDDYGDIGRVQRQQMLMKALLKQLTNPMVIPRLPGLISSMQKYIDTNLSTEELLALVGAGRKLSQGNFKMVMLPGRFSAPGEFQASYWIMDPVGRDRVMQQYFNVSAVDEASNPTASTTSLRIAIQNASSKPDAAYQLRQHLVKLGFNNVSIAPDWAERQPQTEIVVQQGDLSGAAELKQRLGFGSVEADSTGDLESDLTIRVGEDWVNKER
ncbi:LCP family protein [Kovacikia minuta CCNUW1]|uniref:LCP family protein n=1 Tax=Kovacikia minuta TaxID=2931930 RepID=UPI001CCF90CF|nr:LCP family protein [Kovacikia minuta]UBF24521.1 LCP family protein [Kovacikia minuta CCNUW1]